MKEHFRVKELRRVHQVVSRRVDGERLIVDAGRPGHPEDQVRWWSADSETWRHTPYRRADLPLRAAPIRILRLVNRYLLTCG